MNQALAYSLVHPLVIGGTTKQGLKLVAIDVVYRQLPNEYDGNNSQVFISYSSINSAAGLYDSNHDGVFDLGNGYETPIGMDVKFVAIAEFPNGDYYYHITSNTTVTLNHYETIPIMTGPISHSALEVILNNNLP